MGKKKKKKVVTPTSFKQAAVWSKPASYAPRYVGMIGKARVYGGDKYARDDKLWTAVIDANNMIPPESPIAKWHNVPTGLVDAGHMLRPAFLGLNWDDGGTPQLDRAWWVMCVEWVSWLEGNVLVCCHGGMGRTGTMLAALFGVYFTKGKSDKDELDGGSIVEWVREHYLETAIETETQIDYLDLDLGLPVGVDDVGSFELLHRAAAPVNTTLAGWSAVDEPCFECGAEVGKAHDPACTSFYWEAKMGDIEDAGSK